MSLRDRCIEAMMSAERDAGFETDPTASEIALDALLSVLSESADEWVDAAGRETGFYPHGFVIDGLLAVLQGEPDE
jgi:hypothetical protein